mgnify:CR=1 FL=1
MCYVLESSLLSVLGIPRHSLNLACHAGSVMCRHEKREEKNQFTKTLSHRYVLEFSQLYTMPEMANNNTAFTR